MRRSVTTGMGAVLVAAALAGCGGSSSGSPSDSSSATAAGASASPVTSSEPAAGSSAAAFTDVEACDWLKENLPTYADIKSEVGVQAQLTIGLASFFDQHGGLQNADGYAYDEATLRGCKAEHDKAIKLAGIKSFGNL